MGGSTAYPSLGAGGLGWSCTLVLGVIHLYHLFPVLQLVLYMPHLIASIPLT